MIPATRSLPLVLVPLVILIACQHKDVNSGKINQQLIRSLNESNTSILMATTWNLKALEDMTIDPRDTERATKWYENGIKINKTTLHLIRLIDSVIDNSLSSNRISEMELELLYDNTVQYKDSILKTESDFASLFSNQFNFINQFFEMAGRDSVSNKFLKNPGISTEKAVLLLNALKNKAMNLENKFIIYCMQKTTPVDHGFDSYSLILNQNAQSLSPGAYLEINAGVGALSKAANTVISIGKTNIPLNEEGLARFRKKVPDTPGTYKIPLSVSFYNSTTGKQEKSNVYIEYKVINPCE